MFLKVLTWILLVLYFLVFQGKLNFVIMVPTGWGKYSFFLQCFNQDTIKVYFYSSLEPLKGIFKTILKNSYSFRIKRQLCHKRNLNRSVGKTGLKRGLQTDSHKLLIDWGEGARGQHIFFINAKIPFNMAFPCFCIDFWCPYGYTCILREFPYIFLYNVSRKAAKSLWLTFRTEGWWVYLIKLVKSKKRSNFRVGRGKGQLKCELSHTCLAVQARRLEEGGRGNDTLELIQLVPVCVSYHQAM